MNIKQVKELLTIGNKSMVQQIYDDGTTKSYSIVTNLDNAKAFGKKWDSTYAEHLCWGKANEYEDAKKACVEDLHNLFGSSKENDYKEIINKLLGVMFAEVVDNTDELVEYMTENDIMTEEELEEFGYKASKKYDIVTVKITRKFICEKTLVVPHEEDAENYIDSSDIQDCDFEESNTWEYDDEIEVSNVDSTNITYEEASRESTYNDIDDLED